MTCWPPTVPSLSLLNKNTIPLLLALRRKLAVCASIGGWLGIGRWPRAIPTMAVIWVSVPNTWIGIPVVFPAEEKTPTNFKKAEQLKNKSANSTIIEKRWTNILHVVCISKHFRPSYNLICSYSNPIQSMGTTLWSHSPTSPITLRPSW